MNQVVLFNEIVEISFLEEQESFVDAIRKRVVNHLREEIALLVASARKEQKAGKLRPESPDEIMQSLLS